MATNAEKIAALFSARTETKIRPAFNLNKKAKAAVAKGAAAAQMGRLQAAETRRRKEAAAAAAAAKQAERQARYQTLKDGVKNYGYLIANGATYHFPKTGIHPELFAEQCARLGLNAEFFNFAAVKPRNSAPIETTDFRVAFWLATRSVISARKKVIWFNLKSAAEVVAAINPKSVGIWVDKD